jgi:hypothetical protein
MVMRNGPVIRAPAAGSLTGSTLASGVTSSSLTTLGTIATGVWQGTDVGVAYGGTGVSTLATNKLLTGNGTSAITSESNLSFDGSTLTVTGAIDATTDFTIGATIITDGVITDAGGLQIAAAVDLANNTLSNVANAENVWNASGIVHARNNATRFQLRAYNAAAGNTAEIRMAHSMNGTVGSHTAMAADDILGELSWQGSNGSGFATGAQIKADATETWSGSAQGTRIEFYTVDNTTTTPDLRGTIDQNGGIFWGAASGGSQGVGTANFVAAYDDGTILTTDYIFDLYFDGKVLPDDEEYAKTWLPTVAETLAFTRENRHLPWIIGREEWERDGRLSLGQIQKRLWEGQEQQQLHLFEHEIRLVELKAAVADLEKQLAEVSNG